MVQQTQPMAQPPIVPVQQPIAVQPVVQLQPEGEASIWKKWWLWFIIAVVIIGASVGVYFLLK